MARKDKRHPADYAGEKITQHALPDFIKEDVGLSCIKKTMKPVLAVVYKSLHSFKDSLPLNHDIDSCLD